MSVRFLLRAALLPRNEKNSSSVTTNALRWIDKAGGLDNYVLNTPPQKLLSTSGMALRERILAAKNAGGTAELLRFDTRERESGDGERDA